MTPTPPGTSADDLADVLDSIAKKRRGTSGELYKCPCCELADGHHPGCILFPTTQHTPERKAECTFCSAPIGGKHHLSCPLYSERKEAPDEAGLYLKIKSLLTKETMAADAHKPLTSADILASNIMVLIGPHLAADTELLDALGEALNGVDKAKQEMSEYPVYFEEDYTTALVGVADIARAILKARGR